MAKSNPSLPPYDPPEPEYPFQYLAADNFHYGNKDYCVLVDRYSHWLTVFIVSRVPGASPNTFGIGQEIATDGASVFTGGLESSHPTSFVADILKWHS